MNNKGITLIVLIITILVMLILIAISVKILINSDLIGKIEKVANVYQATTEEETNIESEVFNEWYQKICEHNYVDGTCTECGKEEGFTNEAGVAIIFGNLSWSNGTASVTVSKATENSCILQYKKNTGEYTTIEDGGTISGLYDGDVVTARLWDGTNEKETKILNVEDKITPTTPTLAVTSGTLGNNSWYKSNVTVTITAGTDAQSGVSKTTYVVTGAQTASETTGTSVTITTEGTSVITSYTYDNAGNVSSAGTLTIKKDTVAPVFSGLTETTLTNTYDSTAFTSGVSVTDATSGVNGSYSYTPTTLSNGENTITYTATDNAGNTTTNTRTITFIAYTDAMTAGVEIGDYVNYTPSGTPYVTTLTVTKEYSGVSDQTVFLQETEWRVFSINSDGTVEIISATPLYIGEESGNTTLFSLKGALGYNFGIDLLNDLCDVLYRWWRWESGCAFS